MDNTIKILETSYQRVPTFSIFISCETEIIDIDITELRTDIQKFKEYLVDKYYKKDEKKDWFKFWKK